MIDSTGPAAREDDTSVGLIAVVTLESFLRENLPSGQLASFAKDVNRRPGRAPGYVAELVALRQPVERLAVQVKREPGPFGPRQADTVGRAAADVLVCVRRLLDAFEAYWATVPQPAKADPARSVAREMQAELLVEWAEIQQRFWPDGNGPELPGSRPPEAGVASLSVDVAALGRSEGRWAVLLQSASAALYLIAMTIATLILLGLSKEAAELPVEIAKLAITIPLVLLARQLSREGAERRSTGSELRRTRLMLDHFDEYWPDPTDVGVHELRTDLWKRLALTAPTPSDPADGLDIEKVSDLIKTVLGR